VKKVPSDTTVKLVDDLETEYSNLSLSTGQLLDKQPKDYKEGIDALIKQADRWVAFEGRCISAANDLQAGENDAGVREALAKRAKSLMPVLEAANKESKSPIKGIDALQREIQALIDEAGPDGASIVNALRFDDRIEICKQKLQDVSDSIGSDDLYKKEIKQLFGFDIVAEAPLGLGFPYKNFRNLLKIIPRDHSLTAALTRSNIVPTKVCFPAAITTDRTRPSGSIPGPVQRSTRSRTPRADRLTWPTSSRLRRCTRSAMPSTPPTEL